ncbi:MAG: response regulator transcription factor [Eubacterium coprostanoligenes]|uniref:response regulator transcription factor n=1 Tax=Eubacterium coprostanoligenes TaxID=290054 RepID=UPI002409549A|nr:response regulator transcription factor [Eubacterium coprostanoligenes]MDD6664991.1 response regulator transcription factor [Eubacterium coprostanoligenes]
MYTVLVCDDDIAIQNSIKIYLENEGYNVLTASDGEECIKVAENNEVHCLILDIMMPKIDGLNAMLKIRENKNFPIILLSAKSEDTDKITGLSFGADDYVTKPFNPLELMARVKSQIRRYSTLGSMVKTDSQLITGGLVLDTKSKRVTVDGEEVHLTACEYRILEYLMQNMNVVLSSSQIYEAVWNEASFGIEKIVTVHIRNIREKIEINPKDPKYLKVVYGLGYKIEKY